MRRMFAGIVFIMILIVGCSGSPTDSPLMPSEEKYGVTESLGGRILLAAGKFQFDMENGQLVFLPQRGIAAHYDVTAELLPPNCNDCLTLELVEFNPGVKRISFLAELKNKSGFTAYDVRGVLLTEGSGTVLLNPDSYTSLWGTDGEINPFVAYAKEWPFREVKPATKHTGYFELEYTSISDLKNSVFLIDASWPGNCKEPYEISGTHSTAVFQDYLPADIWCQVFDWQDDVESVSIDLTCLGLESDVEMTHTEDGWWVVEDVGWVTGGFYPGTHQALIEAKSSGSDDSLFQNVSLTLSWSDPQVKYAVGWGAQTADVIAMDPEGNTYIAGRFGGTVDFDPGEGVEELDADSYWLYILKLDQQGEFVWVKAIESLFGNIWADGLEFDADGNIYLLVTFVGIIDLDPGPGVIEHIPDPLGGYKQFLAKYTPEWDLKWYHVWGGEMNSFVLDDAGNSYITGTFGGTQDFDPGDGVTEATALGFGDAFLKKFNSDGEFQWVRTWGGDGWDLGTCAALDSFGNVYVGGDFQETVDFDTGPGVLEYSSNGEWDGFYSKFGIDGAFKFVKRWGGVEDDFASGIVCDTGGNVLVTGSFREYLQNSAFSGTSKGGSDIFTSKFSPSGNLVWARTMGGIGDDYGAAVTTDVWDNIYITGGFAKSVDFDPGSEGNYIKSRGARDIFLLLMYPVGVLHKAYAWGGEEADMGRDLVVDDSLNSYVTGTFKSTAYFDKSPWVEPLVSIEYANTFMVKVPVDGM